MADRGEIFMKINTTMTIFVVVCIIAVINGFETNDNIRKRRSVIEFDAMSVKTFVHEVSTGENREIHRAKREVCGNEIPMNQKYDTEVMIIRYYILL